MKKILLATTTLVGVAGLFAGAALAESPKVTVGGFADFQFGHVSDDGDATQRAYGFRNSNEITFHVDGRGDNGLGYGAGANLQADTSGSARGQGMNATKTFVYLDGNNWGRFEMGSTSGAEATMKVDAANIARATGGINGDWVYFANNRTAIVSPGNAGSTAQFIATPDLPVAYGLNGMTNRVGTANNGSIAAGLGGGEQVNINKITYYTPRWSGFQLGVSYAPNDRDRGQTTNRVDTGVTATGGSCAGAGSICSQENIISGGISYDGKFSGVGIALAATGETGNSESASYEDLRAWNVGAKLSYMGFSLAGSYGDWGDSYRLASESADESKYWTAGAAYEYGPFGASVTYLDSKWDRGTVATDNEFKNISVGVDYKLAPGLTPYAEASFFEMDPTGTGVDNDGTVIIVGTQLAF